MDHSAAPRRVKEKLLVSQDGEDLALALYLDPQVIEHLARDDPTKCLHAGNFGDFAIALEGVSHFLYLAWNATHDRGVSLLELELQAEIDKYIGAVSLLAGQGKGHVPKRLHRLLFDMPVFDPSLDTHELERYRDATRYANKYCRQLEERYLSGARCPGMMRELRRFYRLSQAAKIRRIEHA